jgi:hypothetical protein
MASLLLDCNQCLFGSNTNTEFQLWGNQMSTSLLTAGWNRTNYPGNVDWSSVSVNTSTATTFGTEVWNMTDALQATAPVYMKLSYGSSTSFAIRAGLIVQLCSGVTSAGVLTGATSVAIRFGSYDRPAGANISHWCGDTNRWAFSLGSGAATHDQGFAFSIERTHDAAGNDTDEDRKSVV